MELQDAAWHIADFLQTKPKSAYLRTEPDVLDFTSNAPGILAIEGEGKRIELDINPQNVKLLIGILDATVFDREQLPVLFTWNLKSLMSYFRHYVPKFVTPTTSLIDLQCIENFIRPINQPKGAPRNFVEALNRVRLATQSQTDWKPVYRSVHLPLALRVLPSIENTPLLSEETKGPVYPFYEIEGQINGRMNNYKKFEKSYLPYTMGPDVKASLIPRGYNLSFLTSDYRACEVAVLQWLSQDEALKEILDSGDDIHSRIYQKLTGDTCNTENKRKLSKKTFLPVMYGLGPSGLSQALEVSENTAKEIFRRIRTIFATAYDWIESKQTQAESGDVKDYFGRIRRFAANEAYKARNFSVQGVAATVCLEKLIALHGALGNIANLCFTIHDGYGLVCHTEAAPVIYEVVKQTLESESKLCSGLKMKVEVRLGKRLSDMQVFSI